MPASAPGPTFTYASRDVDLAPKLIDDAGNAVAGAMKEGRYFRYFAPSAPLVPGRTYTLTFDAACDASSETATTTETFTVGEDAPLPAAAGTLTFARAGRAELSPGPSTCGSPVDAGYVDLAFAPDRALEPWRHVLSWRVEVDGQSWYHAGTVGDVPTTLLAESKLQRESLRLFTACDRGKPGVDDGLTEGVHLVQVIPQIVGDDRVIGPASLRVTVSCGQDNGEIDVVTPTATPGGGASPSDSNAGCACSTGAASSRETSGEIALGALGCALALGVVRRRVRRLGS